MQRVFKIVAHVVLFLVAIIVFYLGLGIGLAANPAIGTALWVAAAAIAAANLFWILRGRWQKQ